MNKLSNSFTDDELRGMITGDNPQSNAYRELLPLREAGKEPVALVDIQSARPDGNKFALVFNTAMHKLPDDVYHLYAAPQLPAVPDGAEQRLAAAVELLKQAAPHMLADESLKDPGGVFCGKMPAVPDDTKRMDWLCSKTVQVRDPMVYGSHHMFYSQCDSDDDEPHHTTLREQIDAAIAAAPKPGSDNG